MKPIEPVPPAPTCEYLHMNGADCYEMYNCCNCGDTTGEVAADARIAFHVMLAQPV